MPIEFYLQFRLCIPVTVCFPTHLFGVCRKKQTSDNLHLYQISRMSFRNAQSSFQSQYSNRVCVPNVVHQAAAYKLTLSFITFVRKLASLGRCIVCSSELTVIKSIAFPNASSSSQYTVASPSRLFISVPVVSISKSISLESVAVPFAYDPKRYTALSPYFLAIGVTAAFISLIV